VVVQKKSIRVLLVVQEISLSHSLMYEASFEEGSWRCEHLILTELSSAPALNPHDAAALYKEGLGRALFCTALASDSSYVVPATILEAVRQGICREEGNQSANTTDTYKD
jgi:hypothetical protein